MEFKRHHRTIEEIERKAEELKLEKKISWLVTFVRGDHPEYGELTQYVFAKDEETVIEHIKSGYGKDSKIISIK